MGKIYGKQNGENKLIIDGDDIDQRLSALEATWDSIEFLSKQIIQTPLPAGNTPYVQIIYDFPDTDKKIIAIRTITTNRPAACDISSIKIIENSVEIWWKNSLREATTITTTVEVIVISAG